MSYHVRWSGPVPVRVGAPPPVTPIQAAEEGRTFTLEDVKTAIKNVTPTLLVVGVATGAAFAIGSGLVGRYLFGGRR